MFLTFCDISKQPSCQELSVCHASAHCAACSHHTSRWQQCTATRAANFLYCGCGRFAWLPTQALSHPSLIPLHRQKGEIRLTHSAAALPVSEWSAPQDQMRWASTKSSLNASLQSVPFEYGLFKSMIAGGLKFINTRSRLLCMETCWQSSYWHWKRLVLLSSVNQLVQQEFTLVIVSSELTWQCLVTVIWSYWKPRKSGRQSIMLARFLQTSDVAEDDLCGISHSHYMLIRIFTSGVEGSCVTVKQANAVWVVGGASGQNCLFFRGTPDHLQSHLWQPKPTNLQRFLQRPNPAIFHRIVEHLQTFSVATKNMNLEKLGVFYGKPDHPLLFFLKRLFFKKGGLSQAVVVTKTGCFSHEIITFIVLIKIGILCRFPRSVWALSLFLFLLQC